MQKKTLKYLSIKKKYYLPERRISDFNQNYNQELYDNSDKDILTQNIITCLYMVVFDFHFVTGDEVKHFTKYSFLCWFLVYFYYSTIIS